jgi:nitrogen regulatory protein P-II 1
MKLLFVVLNSTDKLEEVLEGLIEVGVTGATVVDSVGMGHIVEGIPLFAGMRSIFRSAKPHNNTIFSVIRDEQADETLQMLAKTLCAAEKGKSAGIAFTVPIERVIGIC